MQGYLNFNVFRKQMKYQYKRDERVNQILERVIHTHSFKNVYVKNTSMPISLKKAYYEYQYGIFAKS